MFLFILLSVLVIGTSSCNEKETKEVYEKENLVGTWELSWTKVYDREVKFLEQIMPTDDYGCGQMNWIFTARDIEIVKYIGKDENDSCLEEVTNLTYTLKNNSIHTLDDLGVEEEMLITNLTDGELVIMTTLPNPIEQNDNAIKYVEIGYKRVK